MAVHRRVSTGDIDDDDLDGNNPDSTPGSPLLRRSFQRISMQRLQAEEEEIMAASDAVTAKTAYMLYLCHFLSTWQARVYEFAAVLFTASAFPENLLASSIFCLDIGVGAYVLSGMFMNFSILCFASLLGTWVDRASSRLATLCTTIVANRISVIAACICWLLIVGDVANTDASITQPTDPPEAFWFAMKKTIFVFIMIFGIIERLSRTANLLSIERDWVPTLAPSIGAVEKYGLTQLNAVMSRIDLVCKLFAPIAISSFVSAVGSMRIVAIALLVLNAATFPAEIATARMVWNASSRLKNPKEADPDIISSSTTNTIWISSGVNEDTPLLRRFALRVYHTIYAAMMCISIWFKDYKDNLHIYFTYHVWIPSLALSVLHFSVLNYSATLTVYLLSSGFSVSIITLAKAFSSVWEIGSTFFYPFSVRICGRLYDKRARGGYDNVIQDEDSTELLEGDNGGANSTQGHKAVFKAEVDMGVATLGIFGLIQMFLSLVPAVFALWTLSVPRDSSAPPPSHSTFVTILLLTTIPMSRFGRWTNHLNTQQLTQTLVPPIHRSGFAGAELALVNLFGMMHWVVTATWSKHEQFKWLALGSVVSVAGSAAMYWWWLRQERRR